MSDLVDRNNPSAWADLLRLALPVIDEAAEKIGGFDWSLGGGTAIALRISHRVSDDVDIFIGRADLRSLSPYLPFKNSAAKALQASVQFPGNYLKLQLPAGEIDFLPGPMLTQPGYTWESFEGRRLALQTCEEVMLRKVRYRSASFKARDVFDLAAVLRASSELAEAFLEQAADRLPILLTAIRRHDADSLSRANIRALASYADLMTTAVSDAARFVEDLLRHQGRP